MEEIFVDEPIINNIINDNNNNSKQKQIINSEFIDDTKLHPDNAFEVFNLNIYINSHHN